MVIEKMTNLVNILLCKDKSGHGMEHIERVLNLSLKFAKQMPANVELVSIISLLHDVDDYKLVGLKNAENFANAKEILNACEIEKSTKDLVINELGKLGYSKRLQGLTPTTIEGKIVSDADMCDAIGASGILRVFAYSNSHGRPFFDRNCFPNLDMTVEQYKSKTSLSSVCHMFEKLLKLKDLMLTDLGKEEAKVRHQFMVDFLYRFFEEENAPEWTNYLTAYLKGNG